MKLISIGHSFNYELEKLIRIFLPFEKITFHKEYEEDSRLALAELIKDNGEVNARAVLLLDGKRAESEAKVIPDWEDFDKKCERVLAVELYKCFTALTGYISDWGILTGVRPAKLFSRLNQKYGLEKTKKYFLEELKVSDNKISLCCEANAGEDKIISRSKPYSFSLYISIPFCPTRCSYCSFVSHSIDKAKKLIPQYVELLCREIEETSKIAKKNNLTLSTVYIGGGTPTSLSAEELDKIMKTVSGCFNINEAFEYTVEAGRPDTITEDKLRVILNNGATRISINPQTMQDSVLEVIGRCHSSSDTVNAFNMARKTGFNNINMDLIAGLPTDTLDGFKDTVGKVLDLNPESVTIHSLAMKRASDLSISEELPEISAGKTTALMVDYGRKALTNSGILPYYMYRQSKTVGNLENVGYAKQGYECLYNVYIMDETHTILACGASAVTKLRQPFGDNISRIFNFKYPYEYIDRYDELLKRKEGINTFYEKYCRGDK